MKYAVFSDVHGNLEAFEAVLKAIDREKVTEYFFVGDIVGYGADPIKCIKILQKTGAISVCGNHDWAVTGLTEMGYFNSAARDALMWTKKKLNQEDIDYLRSLKLSYTDTEITIVHGSLISPEEFPYILDEYNAAKCMALMKTPVCFIGHSHVAGTFYDRKGIVNYTQTDKVDIRSGNKYLVNVGSIGQPRDGDPRAAFCIYDDEREVIEIKRVSYDIAASQEKIIKAKLPKSLATRLGHGT